MAYFMKKYFNDVSREFDEFQVNTHLCKLPIIRTALIILAALSSVLPFIAHSDESRGIVAIVEDASQVDRKWGWVLAQYILPVSKVALGSICTLAKSTRLHI